MIAEFFSRTQGAKTLHGFGVRYSLSVSSAPFLLGTGVLQHSDVK
jgi:hypothetical protein